MLWNCSTLIVWRNDLAQISLNPAFITLKTLKIDTPLHQFQSDTITLTVSRRKIQITKPGSSEIFSLHAVQGIGMLDLFEEYESDLDAHHVKQRNILLFSVFLMLGGFLLLVALFALAGTLLIVGGLAVFIFLRPGRKPRLKSVIRLIIDGVQRDFEYDKEKVNLQDLRTIVHFIKSQINLQAKIATSEAEEKVILHRIKADLLQAMAKCEVVEEK